jgi:hypothetical protein
MVEHRYVVPLRTPLCPAGHLPLKGGDFAGRLLLYRLAHDRPSLRVIGGSAGHEYQPGAFHRVTVRRRGLGKIIGRYDGSGHAVLLFTIVFASAANPSSLPTWSSTPRVPNILLFATSGMLVPQLSCASSLYLAGAGAGKGNRARTHRPAMSPGRTRSSFARKRSRNVSEEVRTVFQSS